jgi:long-chain acyl-CoA synthetase
MKKIWLSTYPDGTPENIDAAAYSSLIEVFEQSFKKFSDRPAFCNFGKTLTYAEMDQYTRDLAAYLQIKLGMNRGDKIAIMMPNLLQNPISIMGALRAGLIVVNTNPLYTADELKHQLNDSGATTIIILENFASVLEKILPETSVKNIIITRMADMIPFPKSMIINAVVKHVKKMVPAFSIANTINFKQVLSEGHECEYSRPDTQLDDYAFLQYTGGTTGVAKAAILTHGNMVANLQQVSPWIGPYTSEGKEIIITALPLYHIFSLLANCFFFMKIGALNFLITNPRDMKGFVKELKTVKFSAITGVNTLFNGLLNTPGFAELDFSNLKITLGGGMAVQQSVADKWQQVTGHPLLEAYGLTETSPAVCICPMNLTSYNGKIGLPVPSTEVTIQNDKNECLPTGESGEICIRGPQLTQGYYNRPDETALAFDSDGWFHSGDIGFMDEQGYFQIVDRKKDMILISGFNVYPNEVEAVISSHPDVLEVGVIGLPDEQCGEIVMAVIVSSNPQLSTEDIQAHCSEHLTRYKIPKRVEFVGEVPKTNVGKILRRKLRDQFVESK